MYVIQFLNRYLVQLNWDRPSTKPKLDCCSIFSIKPDNKDETIPLINNNNKAPSDKCYISFQLDFEAYWMSRAKEWRDSRQFRKELTSKYNKMSNETYHRILDESLSIIPQFQKDYPTYLQCVKYLLVYIEALNYCISEKNSMNYYINHLHMILLNLYIINVVVMLLFNQLIL